MQGYRYRWVVETIGQPPGSMATRNEMIYSRFRHHVGSRPLRTWVSLVGLAVILGLAGRLQAKVETWRQEGPGAFAKAHRDGVVISDNGRVRLGHALAPLGAIGVERVWDLARTREGILLAASGDSGKVLGREPKPGATWNVVYDSGDSQVLALVVTPEGISYAGTGPTGQVVNLTDPKHPASRPDPKVQYIWDLACDQQGNLLAATGPSGQLWKRSTEGRWSLVYDSKASHLLCLAVGPDGSIYAGSDGEGLIYRVSRDGKATIIFDAPQSEIRTLLWGADGALYAGTAAEAGGGNTSRSSMFLAQGGAPQLLDGAHADGGGGIPSGRSDEHVRAAAMQAPPGGAGGPRPSAGRQPQGGSASPKPIAAGDNAVYRLDADGVPREVLRFKALVHALAWVDDRLIVGTGPEGQLFEVRDHGHETAPIAKLDSGQVLSLLGEPDGTLLVGTGDPGTVVGLSPGFASSGSLVSEIHDTKLVSRFGTLSWRAERPSDTTIVVQSRSGNVGEPDETWSAWSAEQTDPAKAFTACPAGRFIQYRVKLATSNPRHSPELRSVSLSYRTANLAPEITRLEIPDLTAADGAAKQTRLNIRWEATDPNEDDLNYSLKVRKEGWPEWIRLDSEPLTEKTFAWDTTAFPSGSYHLKLTASDRPSNSASDALFRERESLVFLVDHDPPTVTVTPKESGASIALKDTLTRLVKADYALDGGPWIPVFPDDELFDSSDENITLRIPDLKRGTHLIMIRTTDAAGNVGTGDALIEVKD
jgi:hypothetical protein